MNSVEFQRDYRVETGLSRAGQYADAAKWQSGRNQIMTNNKPPDEMNAESVELAYKESLTVQEFLHKRMELIDNKIIAVFSVASVAVVIAPTLASANGANEEISGLGMIINAVGGMTAALCWLLALVSWAASATFAILGFWPRRWHVEPNPTRLMGADWLELSPQAFRYWRLGQLGELTEENSRLCKKKADKLRLALVAVSTEVLFIAAGLFLATFV